MYLINSEQREHLKLLRENSPEVAKEICKLALDYMTNGSNNRFQTFASKINTTTSSLQDVINALIMLQCKSVQTNVQESDLALIGFGKEHSAVLWQFIQGSKDLVFQVLHQISSVEYRFCDLDFRFEARISSRSLLHQCVPFITLKFYLDSEKVNENKSPLHFDDSQQQHSRKKEIIFQTDPNNLMYVINVLEKTLQEARTHRVRNIVKNL